MKKIWTGILLIIMLLNGCSGSADPLDPALSLRNRLLKCESFSFVADICADYGDVLQSFSILCQCDNKGSVTFTVQKPETIAGINGTMDGSGGKLTFDDQVLMFSPLADGQISPVSAPWVLVKSLLGGYIRSGGDTADGYRICIDDSYAEDALKLDIWLNEQYEPSRAEILWQGRRILSLDIYNFIIL